MPGRSSSTPRGSRKRPTSQSKPPRAVVLLGQQRFDRSLGGEVRALEVEGRIALVTCGWQEREDDDEELSRHLGGNTINLRLYRRANEVLEQDPELGRAHRERQQVLRHKQDFYRIRLEHELEANHVIRQRKAPQHVLVEEEGASINSIRALDLYHQQQCERVNRRFEETNQTRLRDAVVSQREELAEILNGCDAVAIAGGHVASMLNRLRLFSFGDLLQGQVIFAWSGGAMVMSERIVLFHDNPPQGPGAAELLDSGLGLVPNVVVMPQPETRLNLQNAERVSVLAKRFAPSDCLAFSAGSHVTWRPGMGWSRSSDVLRMNDDGSCTPFGEPLPSAPVDVAADPDATARRSQGQA